MTDKRKKGFTLTQLIVVLVIMAIILAISVPLFVNYWRRAEFRKNESNARTVYLAAESKLTYYRSSGQWDQFKKQVKAQGITGGFDDNSDLHDRIYAITLDQGAYGKSTTLYMVLEYLKKRNVNISTIEDPVEKNIPGINQTQVNPVAGLTFDVGLRALMRQDPDIIMVGETRDGETAATSVRAAITGHVVLSTLHTNDAVSSIVRLEDMGVETYLVANSLVGLVAQRLVRKVCPNCAKQMPTTQEERYFLGENVRMVTRGMGCSHCNNTGYHGRVAVHEILAVNNELRRMIINHESIENMTVYAREHQHMRTLKESGLVLVKEGLTTPEELMKISYE